MKRKDIVFCVGVGVVLALMLLEGHMLFLFVPITAAICWMWVHRSPPKMLNVVWCVICGVMGGSALTGAVASYAMGEYWGSVILGAVAAIIFFTTYTQLLPTVEYLRARMINDA